MKKFLIAVAIMGALVLAACGASPEEPPGPQPVQTEQAETETTPQTETEENAEEEPEEQPVEEPEPTDEPQEPEEPAPEPEPEPAPEIDPVQKTKDDIAWEARTIVWDNYTETDVSNISVNENYGTNADGDYILLVDLKWNVRNSADMTNQMLAMYSEDFAARVGSSLPDVSEFTIFWTVPYYSADTVAVKYSYARQGAGMYQTDRMSLFD